MVFLEVKDWLINTYNDLYKLRYYREANKYDDHTLTNFGHDGSFS